MTPPYLPFGLDQPSCYRIRVQGRLGAGWSETFGGLEMTVESPPDGPPVTTLEGQVADQASLHGLLNYLRDLGLPLLLVQRLDA